MAATSQTLVNNAVLASTLAARSKGYVDQISKQLPLFYWLKKKGQYKPESGERIEWAVEYGLDDSQGPYQGFDILPLQEQDNVTIAIANWKQYHKAIVISGLDRDVKNQGDAKVFDLLAQKEANALNSLQTEMNADLYLDGTGHGSKDITGLAAIIAETTTSGTLFGINRANETWWRNVNVDMNDNPWDATLSEPTLRNKMLQVYTECGRLKVGGPKDRHPDLILTTENGYYNYDQMCSKIGQRFVNTDTADAGFANLKYMGATIIADQDCPEDAGSDDKMFFINSAFMKLIYAPKRNFKTTPFIQPADQDAFAALVLWSGELIATNCAKHGLLQGIKNKFSA